jgi:sucrose-phosphate synthase
MKEEGLYIVSISVHGLIRGIAPELGKDADTGGQIKYVLEMARALSEMVPVAQVDLLTRRIADPALDPIYNQKTEDIADHARIVRLFCGGKKYIRKELLWPHLERFIDRAISYINQQQRSPDLFHGHYADGGYVAMELAAAFDVPFIFTGHSLGRNKLAKLKEEGLSTKRIENQYKISTRIEAEEKIIKAADLIICSTSQEIDEQYGLYENGPAGTYQVIPPGLDPTTFYPYYDPQFDPDLLNAEVKQIRTTLLTELHRFWVSPEKPFILALCRPDHRKNIGGLLRAYGTDKELKAIANLAVFAGIRSDIAEMEDNERAVLTDMLLDMDRYDLYGKLAIPKKHDFGTEVPELYRLCAESGGVFVNPALVEPFGLTLIEASACGVPIVATDDGGPREIVSHCENGILVDVTNHESVAAAIKSILFDDELWRRFSNNGINGARSRYSWQAFSESYLDCLKSSVPQLKMELQGEAARLSHNQSATPSFGRRLNKVRYLMITDIDNTLVGNDDQMRLLFTVLGEKKQSMAWGVATGRSLEMTIDAMTEYEFPVPDILVCSVGTEIYYGPDFRIDKGWQHYISYQWKPERIRTTLEQLEFLNFQEAEGQRSHKISFYLEEKDGRLMQVKEILAAAKLRCQLIYSHGQYLDILPLRASKGRAVEFLLDKYHFSPRNVMVAGDSGNDEDMITSHARGLVVENHSEELDHLKGRPNIYFSPEPYAAGILDGLRHFAII